MIGRAPSAGTLGRRRDAKNASPTRRRTRSGSCAWPWPPRPSATATRATRSRRASTDASRSSSSSSSSRCSSVVFCCSPSGPRRRRRAAWKLLRGRPGRPHPPRHHHAGVGDPPGMRLDECSTQRNLTDEGRAHARRVVGLRQIPVDGDVEPLVPLPGNGATGLQSAEVWTALGNLFDRPQNRPSRSRRCKPHRRLRRSGNVVLVSHGSTISALTGINPDPAEMVVLTPQGGAPVHGRRSSRRSLTPSFALRHEFAWTSAMFPQLSRGASADRRQE